MCSCRLMVNSLAEAKVQIEESVNTRATIPNRYFTLAEANQVLTGIRPSFELALVYTRKIHELTSKRLEPTKIIEARPRISKLRLQIEGLLDPIRHCGIEVGNLFPGTLDFPALRNGEQVYVSWRLGDKDISWWRPMIQAERHRMLVHTENICWEWRN